MIEDAQKVIESNSPNPYYDHYKLFEKDFWGFLPEEILKYSYPGMDVLDLGCGYGTMAIWCRLMGLNPFCLDNGSGYVSPGLLEKYRLPYIKCDLETEKITTPDLFNIIISTEVIEHIANTSNYLGVIADHLVPRGRLFLSTPDADSTWGHEPETVSGHVHHYTVEEIRDLFSSYKIILLESRDVSYQEGRKHIYLVAEKS